MQLNIVYWHAILKILDGVLNVFSSGEMAQFYQFISVSRAKCLITKLILTKWKLIKATDIT
jgi:hypothetical protein